MHRIFKMKDRLTAKVIMKALGRIHTQSLISTQQLGIVQSTWKQVEPIAEQAAMLFYDKLFELDPSLKSLFKTDMGDQGLKLMQTISFVVNGLGNPETIIPVVQALGERHKGYGVEAQHYDTVAAALLWTLEQGLGEMFTDDVGQAWVAVYTLLATTMQQAAEKAA